MRPERIQLERRSETRLPPSQPAISRGARMSALDVVAPRASNGPSDGVKLACARFPFVSSFRLCDAVSSPPFARARGSKRRNPVEQAERETGRYSRLRGSRATDRGRESLLGAERR